MKGVKKSEKLKRCEKLLRSVAPDVSELTGVHLELTQLEINIVDHTNEEHMLLCLKQFAKNVNIPYDEIYAKYKKSNKLKILSLLGKFLDLMVGGMYEKCKIIIPERVVDKSNDRDLKIIIAHELVHYTQDIVAPEMLNILFMKTWELLKEEMDIQATIHYDKQCPRCGADMELREGKYGKFWGCVKYDQTGCRGSYNYWYKMNKLIKGDKEEKKALQIEMAAIEGYAAYIEHILEQKYKQEYKEFEYSEGVTVLLKFLHQITLRPLLAIANFFDDLMKDKQNQYIWGEGVIKYLVREKGCGSKFEDLLEGIRRVIPSVSEVETIIEFHDLKLNQTSVMANIDKACTKIQDAVEKEVLIDADSEKEFIIQAERTLPLIFKNAISNIDLDEFIPHKWDTALNDLEEIEDGGKLFYYVFLLPTSREIAIICDMIDQRYKQVLAKFKKYKRKLREVVQTRDELAKNNLLENSLNILYILKTRNEASKDRKYLLRLMRRVLELDMKYRFYIKYRESIRSLAEKVLELHSSPIIAPSKDEMFYTFDNYRVCPDCNVKMESRLTDHVMSDICPECGIIFLDQGELNTITDYKDLIPEISAIPSLELEDVHAARRCPECSDQIMEKYNLFDDSGIILDVCSNCRGLVLDPEEMAMASHSVNQIKEKNSIQSKFFGIFRKLSKTIQANK